MMIAPTYSYSHLFNITSLKPPRMPGLQHCIKKISIYLDDPPNATHFFSPGDTLSGIVEVKVSKSCVGAVNLSVTGRAKVKTCTKLVYSDTAYYTYFSHQETISEGSRQHLGRGELTFPFSVKLPPDIPSSIIAADTCGCNVQVEYAVKCSVDPLNSKGTKATFLVRRPWVLDDPRYLRTWQKEATGGATLRRSRKATLFAELPTRAFMVGTTLTATIRVENHYGPSTHNVSMKLKRVTVILGTDSEQACEFLPTTFPLVVSRHIKVKPKTSEMFEFEMPVVPDLQPSRLMGATGLDLFYIIEVKLSDRGGEKLAVVRTPVAICTGVVEDGVGGPRIEVDSQQPKIPLPDVTPEMLAAIPEQDGGKMPLVAPPPYAVLDPAPAPPFCPFELPVGVEAPPPYHERGN